MISPLANLSTPGSIQLRQNAFTEITEILNNTAKIFNSTCQQCISSLLIFKNLALTAPWEVPPLLIQVCLFVKFDGKSKKNCNYRHHSNIIIVAYGSCEQEFMANSDGQISTQLLANADVTGQDGQASILFCNSVK